MKNKRVVGRDILWMTIPCILILIAGRYMTVRVPPRPIPVPTPTPRPFRVKVKRFRLEPVNAENKKRGADTCMTVETRTENAPPNVQWFYCRRLIATKNGKTTVLWTDNMASTANNPEVARMGEYLGTEIQTKNHLFKLRDVPPERGEISFLWDAVAQPVKYKVSVNGEKQVNIQELERVAKKGGLRLSRRLVVRKASVE